ncbi:GNAT family N-acetyltransferase [Streptomyces sp. 891-h]|uniref:GNAT family N-acetyltransferase n=1 Tax=Streptomyces sp. 891-h TaxID=2720714 RepID=UPI001FAAE05E|nr:GNAT family N-acetyltransferase [Streptomyces sp. 891-h]
MHPATAPELDRELITDWVVGWAASRGTPAPVERPWGFYMDIRSERLVGRHVLLHADEATVRAAAAAVTVPSTWLMVFAEPDRVAAWLPPGWEVDHAETGHLMSVGLETTDPVPPDGYTRTVETRDGVTRVWVHAASGETAAAGQASVLGRNAVMDRIRTEEAHRRRGLGGLVMRTLADSAVAAGATLGILGATPQGRALYETLGWKAHTILTECVYWP